jgi:hypothetical protein
VTLAGPDLQALGIDYEPEEVEKAVPHWFDIDQSDPCRQLDWYSGLQPFLAFRLVNSRGPSNFGIQQTVAVYADGPAAKAVFDKYSGYAASCKAKGGPRVFTTATPTELASSVPTADEVGEYRGNIAASDIRVVENVVIDVQSFRRRDGVAMTAQIAERISARVKSIA